MHTRRYFSEINFSKLKNSPICRRKLYFKLSLSKETLTDDKM